MVRGGLSKRSALVVLGILLCLAVVVSPAACRPAAGSFSFVVLGDNRPGGSAIEPTDAFKGILREVSPLQPDFVVNTGDIVCGVKDAVKYRQQVEAFQRVVKDAGLKMYVAQGNHDVRGRATLDVFEKLVNPSYFSFGHKGCHFIILSTCVPGEDGRITGQPLLWPQRDLEAPRPAAQTFVFYRAPLWPAGAHIGSSQDAHSADRDNLARLLRKYHAAALFAGHEHLFHYTARDGLKEYICGGGGAGLVRTREGGYGGYYHYLWVTVTPEGVDVRVVLPGKGFRPENAKKGSWLSPEQANLRK